ncbi:MAG: hypothetical protein VX642_08720 [Bdellovibrionota bacterium]|nr:hypothetical protein [Bdellovibrionota bacterium]
MAYYSRFLIILFCVSCLENKIESESGGSINDSAPELEMKIDNFLVSNLVNINESNEVRALALSDDATRLYTCSLQTKILYVYNKSDGSLIHSTSYGSSPRFCKSMDVHRSGRVYFSLSDSDEIGLADSGLSSLSYVQIEGLISDISDVGNNDVDPQQLYVYENYLYVASDKLGRIYRFILDESNGDILSLDSDWGTSGYYQVKDVGNSDITSSGELLSMLYDPENQSLFAVLEGLDSVVQIKDNGGSQVYDAIDVPDDSSPHDIEIMGSYYLVSYGALDGTKDKPYGVAVFQRSDFSEQGVLKDLGGELRNAQGLVVDSDEKTFYIIDGFFGAPNDITQDRSSDPSAQNILMKFKYIK